MQCNLYRDLLIPVNEITHIMLLFLSGIIQPVTGYVPEKRSFSVIDLQKVLKAHCIATFTHRLANLQTTRPCELPPFVPLAIYQLT